MPWYAAFSPAFFAFFATPPATRIPVPDMTTVTRVRRASRASKSARRRRQVSSRKKTKPPRRAPSARRAARRIFFFSPPSSSRENPQTPAVSGGALGGVVEDLISVDASTYVKLVEGSDL